MIYIFPRLFHLEKAFPKVTLSRFLRIGLYGWRKAKRENGTTIDRKADQYLHFSVLSHSFKKVLKFAFVNQFK